MAEEKELKTQWHPRFVAAIDLEFIENHGDLELVPEYNLTKKPLALDLMVIRKNPGAIIKNELGAIFKRHNIFEYKSPGDHFDIDTFYKVIAYACLYKIEKEYDDSGKVIHRSADDITISLVRNEKPEGLFKQLSSTGFGLEQSSQGIYRVDSVLGFNIQIIVSGELSPKHHRWLSSLRRDVTFEHLNQVYEAMNEAKGTEYLRLLA